MSEHDKPSKIVYLVIENDRVMDDTEAVTNVTIYDAYAKKEDAVHALEHQLMQTKHEIQDRLDARLYCEYDAEDHTQGHIDIPDFGHEVRQFNVTSRIVH